MNDVLLVIFECCIVVKTRWPFGENVGLGQVLREKTADRNNVIVVTRHVLLIITKTKLGIGRLSFLPE